MGQEISASRFTREDFAAFEDCLRRETDLLSHMLDERVFSSSREQGGFEVEAWLIDRQAQPAAINETFLERLGSPLVVPELSRYNVELNSSPCGLEGDALRRMEEEFTATLGMCRHTAAELDAELLMIGILPTIRDQDLTLANMSTMKRYRALNEQVMRLRQGRPLKLDILGREHLVTEHRNVMLESAATSFQIHLLVPLAHAVRYMNSAMILSGPMVAACANSPYLFGKDLWDETRIPLFEQAVEVGGLNDAAFGPMRRVTFGTGYVRESIAECFTENLEHYPVLLPMQMEGEAARFAHLRLHNGTIWRWNRPLIGFDGDGTPHLRIEHRVLPSGPSVVDSIANAALFFGLAFYYASLETPPETAISFPEARDNFYAAGKNGLRATLAWYGKHVPVRTLLAEELLEHAHQGLRALGIRDEDRRHYLGIIAGRVDTERTGAVWQRESAQAHGRDMQRMTATCLANQRRNTPVHTWDTV